ncbi:hypothetical protein [Bremerella cremea]|uniref:hypothetical protein n=1 Tax=Bremerella cremea TaxID=1031537 RepID=UPI0031E9397A
MKILMTDGTSASARQTLYGVPTEHAIDVLAPSAFCQCRFSSKVARWRRCPKIGTEPVEYLRELLGLVRSHQYDLLLPTHEEVYLLSKFRDSIAPHVHLAVPSFDAMRKLIGKIDFAETMGALGLPIPAFEVRHSDSLLKEDLSFPFYLKVNLGTAGLGVRLVRNAEDLTNALAEFRDAKLLENEPLLVQQPATGQMCVGQAVYQDGQLMGAHSAKVLIDCSGGGAMLRESVHHPGVIDDLKRLGSSLGLHGAIFVEYLYDDATQTPSYIECNPRIGESVNAVLSGVPLVKLFCEISAGQVVDSLPVGKEGVRSHTGFVRLMWMGAEGATRRSIRQERSDMRSRRGRYERAQNETTRPDEDRYSVWPARFVGLRLLLRPVSGAEMIKSTVMNYSLPSAACRKIDALPADFASQILEGSAS